MINKKITALILGILVLFICAYSYAQYSTTNFNNTINNSTVKKNSTASKVKFNTTLSYIQKKTQNGTSITNKENYVTITHKGPTKTQKRGNDIIINYTIENKGNNTVYVVTVWNWDVEKFFGTLKPGETIKSSYSIYLPTDEDFIEMTGDVQDMENPCYVGSIEVWFKDSKGVSHVAKSNHFSIKWI